MRTSAVRTAGAVTVTCGAGALGLLAATASLGDISTRLTLAVYPIMVLALIGVCLVSGIVMICRPALGGHAAVPACIAALQVAGAAAVAYRDWANAAGAGATTYVEARNASALAAGVAALSLTAVAVSVAVIWAAMRARGLGVAIDAKAMAAAAVVAVGLPVALASYLHMHVTLSAVGQFALWWSLPWAVGIAFSGMARGAGYLTAVARMSVAASVLLVLASIATSHLIFGYGIRLPN